VTGLPDNIDLELGPAALPDAQAEVARLADDRSVGGAAIEGRGKSRPFHHLLGDRADDEYRAIGRIGGEHARHAIDRGCGGSLHVADSEAVEPAGIELRPERGGPPPRPARGGSCRQRPPLCIGMVSTWQSMRIRGEPWPRRPMALPASST